MDNSSYECPLHKIQIHGTKRDDFQATYYNLLLNVPMSISMRLYKEVNVACHCTKNYDAFDSIVNEANATQESPKDFEQSNK
jgi:hypothetical protein